MTNKGEPVSVDLGDISLDFDSDAANNAPLAEKPILAGPGATSPETAKAAKRLAAATELFEYQRLLLRGLASLDAQRQTAQEALKNGKAATKLGDDVAVKRLLAIVQDAAASMLSGCTVLIEGLADVDTAPRKKP